MQEAHEELQVLESVMTQSNEEERIVLECMNKLPNIANERGKDYAKRITSRVDIDGEITFGIILPEGGRADVGKVNPLVTTGFSLINELNSLLDICDSVWEVMQPTSPPSPNTKQSEEDIKSYLAKVDAKANEDLARESKDVRHLWNTAPKIKYISDIETTVGYQGLIAYIPADIEIDLPEPWYDRLIESRAMDKARMLKQKKFANIEHGALDAELINGRMGN